MDIARPDQARKRRRRRIIYAGLSLLVLVLITVGLMKLEPALPSVSDSLAYKGTVKRGEMLRNVALGYVVVAGLAAWALGGRPELEGLRLRAWAHMLGFGGHWSTKSRRYSTTFTVLRRARVQFAKRRRARPRAARSRCSDLAGLRA